MHLKNLSALVLLFVAACGGPLSYAPKTSARAPGTEVEVVADVKNDQHSTTLDVKMKHLPPPGAIQEGAKVFVVWQRKSSDGQWARVAGLAYKEGDREGKLEKASVPETAFELMVTAEETADGASPSPNVVVEQKVNK